MTTTAPDADVLADPATARRLLELALDHGPSLEGRTAGEILEWGAEHLRTPLAVTMSMQDTVLAELASRHAPDADLIFLDTGYHFPETLQVAADVDERYDNRLITVTPADDAVPELYRTDVTACCLQRKLRWRFVAMCEYEAFLLGIFPVVGC